MSANWEIVDPNEGVVVHISDVGRQRLATEQQANQAAQTRDEIRLWSLVASVLAVAGLLIKHLWG